MSESVYNGGVLALLALAPGVFAALFFVVAPYGRHARERWGPTLPARTGWVLMELPAPVSFVAFFVRGDHAADVLPVGLASLFLLHYLQRTFVFPLRMRGEGRRNPLALIALSAAFNALNGSLNGWAVGCFARPATAWLVDPRFVAGLGLFFAGLAINWHADSVLRGLRRPGESGYRIPDGGLYRWVSCPNYLGEIVEWIGWAVATWTGAGAAFALFTFANLAPRAVANHRWYREYFPDYPRQRRAWLPGLW